MPPTAPNRLNPNSESAELGPALQSLVARAERSPDLVHPDDVQVGGGGHRAGDVEHAEQLAAVAVSRGDGDVGCVGGDGQAELVGSPPAELGEVVAVERLELEHRAAAEERADDRRPGALGRGADQRDDAGLHRRPPGGGGTRILAREPRGAGQPELDGRRRVAHGA